MMQFVNTLDIFQNQFDKHFSKNSDSVTASIVKQNK